MEAHTSQREQVRVQRRSRRRGRRSGPAVVFGAAARAAHGQQATAASQPAPSSTTSALTPPAAAAPAPPAPHPNLECRRCTTAERGGPDRAEPATSCTPTAPHCPVPSGCPSNIASEGSEECAAGASVRGSCPFFCPRGEVRRRLRYHELSPCERAFPDPKTGDDFLAVTAYHRSAAGVKFSEEDVRSLFHATRTDGTAHLQFGTGPPSRCLARRCGPLAGKCGTVDISILPRQSGVHRRQVRQMCDCALCKHQYL